MATKNNYTDKLKDIMNYEPSWIIRYGNSSLLLFLVGLLLLMNFIKFPEVIEGEAILTSKNPPQKITSKINASIDTIFVKENQVVTRNQPLLIFENDASYKDVLYLLETFNKNPIKSDSIYFPIDSMPILALGSIQKAYSKFEKLYLELELFRKLNQYEIKIKANLFNTEEKKRKLSSLKNQLSINYRELKLLRKNVARSKSLLDQGIIAAKEFENDQLIYFDKEKSINFTKVLISELKDELSNTDENYELNKLESSTELKQLIKSLIHSYNELIVGIKNWERNYLLKSEKEGIVTFNETYTKNQYLEENEFIGSIVNIEEKEPLIKIYAPIKNSGKIKKGQQVNIKFDNFNYMEFGIIYGTVNGISKLPNEEDKYLIDVELTNGLKTSYEKELNFYNEVTGKAEIITSDITILERVFNQFFNIILNR